MSVNEIKVVVVGNSSVGKTCIVKKATTGVFLEDSVATLGVNYVSMKKNVSKTDFMLQIWDTAGQERYRGMAPLYYRGAHVAIICYSVIDSDSFEAVDFWKKNIIENVDGNVIIILIGNKIDLEGREVTKEEGENKAKELGLLSMKFQLKQDLELMICSAMFRCIIWNIKGQILHHKIKI